MPPSSTSCHRLVLDIREINTSLFGGAQWLSLFFDVLEKHFCAQNNPLNNFPTLILALLDVVLFLVFQRPPRKGVFASAFQVLSLFPPFFLPLASFMVKVALPITASLCEPSALV